MSIYFANEMLTIFGLPMSDEVQFNLRIPAELKLRIAEAAKTNCRSINAEAQLRLEQSFENTKSYTEEEFEKAVNNFLEGFFTASVQACQMSIDQLHAQHGDNLIGDQKLYLEATKLMQSQYKRYLSQLPIFKKKPT